MAVFCIGKLKRAARYSRHAPGKSERPLRSIVWKGARGRRVSVCPLDQSSPDLANAIYCVDLGQIGHKVILSRADLRPTLMLGQQTTNL